ncbi:MAG TPA: endonuclease MutS2 [Armatimonadota bacterium]|nr:endonuclease MutS2 [Armatimonadota bacterium]
MDAHALKVLEFDKIREQLVSSCACSLGRRRAKGIRPSKDGEWIRERLKETSEARHALLRHGTAPFGGLTDVSDLLPKANAGSVLGGLELRSVADALRAARRMRAYFAATPDGELPRLQTLAGMLASAKEFEDKVEATIDEEGEVRNDATDELRSLWRRHAALNERLQSLMQSVLTKETSGTRLQESLIVIRGGRHCIPIRASSQRGFSGIVHDRSDSGATVFMEPLDAVGPGNDLRDTELAIEEEKHRLLQEMTFAVAGLSGDITGNLKTLGVIDFIFAKANLAQRMDATEPGIAEPGTFHLVQARHPLIEGDVVPTDVWIGNDFDTLLITGPNTGGKTVTLRTVGLLCAMMECGLHIPAQSGSEMAVFEEVYADIGDEQGIEQSLSTFSSHMTQIIRVLQKLEAWNRRAPGTVNVLVLLDEVGAGTDPTEGSCLARAILDELQTLGARTLATTHYNELKAFAYTTPRMQNASVEFDVKTLRPTYKLMIGAPGSSNAFDIAQRLGLPRVIGKKARSLLNREDAAVEDVIRRMERTRMRLHSEADLAQEERQELEELQEMYETELDDLQAKRREALEEGFAEAREIVARAEAQAVEIIADLQRQKGQSKVTERRRQQIADLRDEIEDRATQHREEAPPPDLIVPTDVPVDPEFSPDIGDQVHIGSLGRDGIIVREINTSRVLVEVGSLRIDASTEDLSPPRDPIADKYRNLAETLQIEKSISVPQEIHLRGMRAEEALDELEKYLDDVSLAGHLGVRVIHGKGTGALRKVVHEFLKNHRSVTGFAIAEPQDGGDGVTIVEL